MREVSLNARLANTAANTDEIEVVLFVIDHPELDKPARLSTDPTERVSTVPLIYGTRSSWQGSDPTSQPFLFVVASTELPSDVEDSPPAASLILSNVDQDMVGLLRGITDQATVQMAVVLAGTPDDVEFECLDMKLVHAEGNADQITLSVTRAPIWDEIVPMQRFSKQQFPGLWR